MDAGPSGQARRALWAPCTCDRNYFGRYFDQKCCIYTYLSQKFSSYWSASSSKFSPYVHVHNVSSKSVVSRMFLYYHNDFLWMILILSRKKLEVMTTLYLISCTDVIFYRFRYFSDRNYPAFFFLIYTLFKHSYESYTLSSELSKRLSNLQDAEIIPPLYYNLIMANSVRL